MGRLIDLAGGGGGGGGGGDRRWGRKSPPSLPFPPPTPEKGRGRGGRKNSSLQKIEKEGREGGLLFTSRRWLGGWGLLLLLRRRLRWGLMIGNLSFSLSFFHADYMEWAKKGGKLFAAPACIAKTRTGSVL